MARFQVTGRNKRRYIVEAPPDTPKNVIIEALLAKHPEAGAELSQSTPGGEALGSLESVASGYRTALGSIGEAPNQAAIQGAQRAEDIRQRVGESPAFAKVQEAYEKEGLISRKG